MRGQGKGQWDNKLRKRPCYLLVGPTHTLRCRRDSTLAFSRHVHERLVFASMVEYCLLHCRPSSATPHPTPKGYPFCEPCSNLCRNGRMQVQWVRVQLNGGREKEFALLIQSARAARSTCEDKIKTMHVSRFPCIDLDGPGIAAGENGAVAILATDRELVAAGKGRLPSVCQANRKMGIIKRSLEPGIHPSTGRSDCGDIVAVGRLLGDVGEKGCPRSCHVATS